MPINRQLSSLDAAGQWRPEMRLCHLHAMEALTGAKVYSETFEDRERQMLELSA